MKLNKFKVRIKEGARISQDFSYGNWPECKPPKSEYQNEEDYEDKTLYPDAIFDAELILNTSSVYFDCKREGYGYLGNYGNGSIYVDVDGIEILERDQDSGLAIAEYKNKLKEELDNAKKDYERRSDHIKELLKIVGTV